MRLPSKITTWLFIIYFLLVGLNELGVYSADAVVMGILAIAIAVFLLLDR
jgi:hypothetical protein